MKSRMNSTSVLSGLGHALACTALFWLLATNAQAAEQVLHGHVPAAAGRLRPIGRLAEMNRLALALGLPLRNQVTLNNLLHEIYDPASPKYRHYLTPEEFTKQFGPTEQDYEAVIAFAKANGLKVAGTTPNRMLLDVEGSVGDIEKAFHVAMQVYQHPTEGRTFYAPDIEPSLDLAIPIADISGLNNYSLPHPRLKATRFSEAKNAATNTGSGPSGTYMGNDFRAAYVPDTTLNGSGQIVGLLQFDGYTASDIAYYESQAGLSSVTISNVLLDGFSGSPTGNGGEVEVSLDIEMAISMAPGLSEVIVYEAGPSGNWHDLLNRMATDNLASQLSCSWYSPGGGSDTVADQIFQQMAAQGQSFLNASGDDDAYTGLISFPGDSPYITQVGGTTLTTSGPGGAWVSETVWNWDNGIGSGGGISTQYPIPSWQTNINMAANQGSTTMRNTPDVALTADNVYVRADGEDQNVGGTSCAAPLWAGFTALVNQQAAASSKPSVGFINPAVDAIGSGIGANYTSAFHDITTGNNTSSSSPTRFYAVFGYDLCTGWGTPAGQNLINALAIPEALIITPSSGFTSIGGVGGPFTVTSQSLSLTNVGTNSLTWTLANTSLWIDALPGSGTLTPGGTAATVTVSLNSAASNLVVGTYSATVWFTNLNSGFGQSRQFNLSVISPPTITTQPTDQAVLEGMTATFTVGATGGLPLYYQWQYNGTNLTDGGNISGSMTTNLTISNVSSADVGTYSAIVTNVAGVAASSNALLTIVPSTPVITLQPANQTAVAGETVAFTVGVIGDTPYFYQWSFNGTNLDGMTSASLMLANVQLSQAGNYAVVVSNALGSATSSNATLTVYTVPVITSFSPQSGEAGTVVNICGLNFDPTPGNNIVYFGAVQAPVTTASVTNLVVTVPVSATYAPITETVNGLTAYANQPFTPTFTSDGSGISASSFDTQLVLQAGSGPIKVVIADLDGDGKPDLIVANDYGNTISLYRNISTNGSLTAGSFAPRVDLVTLPGSYSPYGLAVADVDGDGKLDIIVSDYDESIVSVYRNTCTPGNISSNSFATRVDFATGAQPQGIAVADIDGDGKPDLLVANTGDGTVSILRNTCVVGTLTTISFAPKVDIPTGSGCDSVAVGDLDGDGKPDVVTANTGNATVSLLRNISMPGSITTNSFAAAVDIPVLSGPIQVAIGDLDGDGKPDLIVAFYLPQTVSVLRNTSTVGSLTTNSFAPMVDFSLDGRGHMPAIADLDGDGKPDVAVVTELNSLLSIFRNVSTPGGFTTNSLAPRVDFSAGYNAWGIAIGDLDGDGRPDIVFCNTYDNTISIYRNIVPFGAAPVITSQPANQTVYVGGTASFSLAATGTLPLGYQWSFNGTNINGATSSTLSLTNMQLAQAGNYAVVVNNAYGTITSSNAVLTVVNASTPDPFNPAANGLVYCTAVQADGKIVVGGMFSTLGGQSRSSIGRLNADGTLDTGFNPGASSTVYSLAVQTNGQIVAGGFFTTLGGQSRSSIGRLNADGTLDTSFKPGAIGPVNSLAVQTNGQILVGGQFTTLGGQSRSYIGRLNANGTLDTSFNPGANGFVYSLAVQTNGQILAGGLFSMLGGQSCSHIGRLNGDGTLDTSFNPGANMTVDSLAVQADGEILVGGWFSMLGGQMRSYLGRLKADGTLDTTFNPVASGYVISLAVQADGKIVVGGQFRTLAGQSQSYLGRLNGDGTLDTTFNPVANNYVNSVAVQADGKIVVGGNFTTLGDQNRSSIGRLTPTVPATQSLAYDGSTITWQRGGSSPEVWRTFFDGATNGSSWIPLGAGTRVAGGWQLSGLAWPTNVNLRARGFVAGGEFNGSGWFVETVIGLPVILDQPASQSASAGSNVTFSVTAEGSQPLGYQWLFNGTNLNGATNSSLTLTNVQWAQAGNYAVSVSNANGSITSSNAVLTVLSPPVITTQPVSYTTVVGTTASFTVAASGTVPLSYCVSHK
jgi:uncharacterized delta-60 repeat protein